MGEYVKNLLSGFSEKSQTSETNSSIPTVLQSSQQLVEPLTQKELKVLRLIAQGLSNREISERLHLALDTVKGYNRRIFNKLGVQRRTEAVARAQSLNLFSK